MILCQFFSKTEMNDLLQRRELPEFRYCFKLLPHAHKLQNSSWIIFTAWKVFVFGDFLVRIFPHSDWMITQVTKFSAHISQTLWELSNYGVFSGSYFPAFRPYSVQIRENTDQKKARIWTLFQQCQSKTNLQWQFFTAVKFPLILNWISEDNPEITNGRFN